MCDLTIIIILYFACGGGGGGVGSWITPDDGHFPYKVVILPSWGKRICAVYYFRCLRISRRFLPSWLWLDMP